MSLWHTTKMTAPQTSATLLRVIGSDPQSARWVEFVEKYETFMIGCIRSHCANINDDELEDVLQNVMIALMKILPNYRYSPDKKGHFKNYLNGICRNTAYQFTRKRKRLNDRVEFRSEMATSRSEDDEELQAPDVENMFAEAWRGQQSDFMNWQRSALEVALQQLMSDPKIRQQNKEIFRILAITGEKSPEEVAKMFNITRNNVDQIKNRMMTKLCTLAHKLKHLEATQQS